MYLAGGFIFLLPFFCNPYGVVGDQLETPKLMAIFLLGSLCLAFFVGEKIHQSVGILTAVFSFSCLYSGFGPNQMYGFAYFVSLLFCAMIFIQAKERERIFFLRIICWSGVFSGLYAVIQILDHDFIFRYAPGIDHAQPIAFLGQKTKYGAFMILCFALSLFTQRWWVSLSLAATALMSGSSMVLGSFIVILILWARHFNYGRLMAKFVLSMAICGLCIAYLLSPHGDLFFLHGRAEIWVATIKATIDGPLVMGFGPGSFKILFSTYFQPASTREHGDFLQAHNDYVQAFFEFGIIGITALLIIFFSLFRYYQNFWWRNKARANSIKACELAFAAIMANALGNFPFQLAPHCLIGVVSACLLLKQAHKPDRIFFEGK